MFHPARSTVVWSSQLLCSAVHTHIAIVIAGALKEHAEPMD